MWQLVMVLLVLTSLVSLGRASAAVHSIPTDNPNHNVLTNGDFEFPGIFGANTTVAAIWGPQDPLMPPGWFASKGAIQYIRTEFWRAASGKHSIGLNNDGPASIAQTFKTYPGESYFVFFQLAGDPGLDHGAHRTVNVTVKADGELLAERAFLVDTYQHMKYDQGIRWEERSVAFTATENHATLTFLSTTEGVHGPVIDNVRVFKREGLSGFFKSENTNYGGTTVAAMGPKATAEACARRCLETPGCAGFTLGIPKGDLTGPCFLKAEMKMPMRVDEFNTDSYILKDAECTFGHHSPRTCAHVLPLEGLVPLACVAKQGWKRTKDHPYPGVCKPLQRIAVCHTAGGYFPLGTPAIGSGDHLRRCSCTKSTVGLATLDCTKTT